MQDSKYKSKFIMIYGTKTELKNKINKKNVFKKTK